MDDDIAAYIASIADEQSPERLQEIAAVMAAERGELQAPPRPNYLKLIVDNG